MLLESEYKVEQYQKVKKQINSIEMETLTF